MSRLSWPAALILFTLAACHAGRSGTAVEAPEVRAATLSVQAQAATVFASVPGTVVSKRHAEIASRLTGFVTEVSVQAGDRVTAGQPLLRIDSSDVTGGLQQAEAGLNQAQAVYDEAESNFQRSGNLYAKGVVSKAQLDAATRQEATARGGLEAAQAALRIAQAQLGYADVRAPFTGVVVDKLVDPGDLATPGKPLLVIEDEGSLEVQSNVSDELYGVLRVGEDIPIATETASFTGKLQSKVLAADAQTHTHLIRIGVPAGQGLMSGRYVRVNIPTGSALQMRVPAGALAERAGITGVFVVDPQGIAHFRLVRAGARRDGEIEIQSGLSPGERIVLRPDAAVDNGTRIVGAGVS